MSCGQYPTVAIFPGAMIEQIDRCEEYSLLYLRMLIETAPIRLLDPQYLADPRAS